MRNDYDAGNQEFDDEDYGSDGLRWMSVVVVLLVVLGFFSLAWYAYRTGGQSETGGDGVPVIEAAGGTLKEKPADPGGMDFPNRDKTIYGAMEKGGNAGATVEHLTEAPEEPVVGRGGEATPETSHTNTYRKEDTAAVGAAVAPAEDGNDAIVAQVNQFEQEMATAKPDAAKTETPKAQDATKDVETKIQTELTASTPTPVAPAVVAEVPVAQAPSNPTPEQAAQVEKPVSEAPLQSPAPVEVAQQQALVAKQAQAPKKEEKPVAKKEEKAKPAAVSSGGSQIQLAAARSRDDAERAWKSISGKHSALLGGLSHAIVTVEVQGKGTFYRVRATGLSSTSASSLCSQLKGRGQDCMW
jgi:hypothetical protein